MTTVLDKANDATPTVDDVLYGINDPAGTPGDRRVTMGNLASAMAGWAPFTGPFAPKAAPTGTGVATWPAFSASGLTGATSGARFVGATVSGAPVTGTYLVGDWIVDQSGQMWICTIAGTSGTWVAPGSGRELGYAESTTSQSGIVGVGSANRVDCTGLSITFTVTASSRPVLIEGYFGSVVNTLDQNGVGLAIVETAGGTILANSFATVPGNALSVPLGVKLRYNTVGTPTMKLMAWVTPGGSGTLTAGAANRAFIRATEG